MTREIKDQGYCHGCEVMVIWIQTLVFKNKYCPTCGLELERQPDQNEKLAADIDGK